MLWHFHTHMPFFCSSLTLQNLEGVTKKEGSPDPDPHHLWCFQFLMHLPRGSSCIWKCLSHSFSSGYFKSETELWISSVFFVASLFTSFLLFNSVTRTVLCCLPLYIYLNIANIFIRQLVEMSEFPPRERSVWMFNPTDYVTVFLVGFQMSCDKTCCSFLINIYKSITLVALPWMCHHKGGILYLFYMFVISFFYELIVR